MKTADHRGAHVAWLGGVLLLATAVVGGSLSGWEPDEPRDAATRTWIDSTGQFRIEAKLTDYVDGNVHLQPTEGDALVVPLTKLSEADRKFLREWLVARRASAEATVGGSPTGQADWPVWRGPNLNGVAAPGQSPPTQWSETENVVWKVPVPGRGHSSPIVVGDKVILTTAVEPQQTQAVLCYSRQDGTLLWTTDVNRGGFAREIHNKNTHASPTAVSDGQRIYVSFPNHDGVQLTALNLEGEQQWQVMAGPFEPQRYKFGYAASPLLYGSSVIVASDFENGGFLAAFDCESGKPLWKTPRPAGKISYSSPIVARVGGKDQLLLSGCEIVAAYDPENGRPLWSANATTFATCGTMVWDGDLVFASGGYPKAETVAIQADGSGRIAWSNREKCYEQSMLAHDGYLYAVNDNGIAFCWNARTGQEQWKARLGGPVSASPVLAGGNIYLSNERGVTFVFKASPDSYQPVARNQLGTEAFATPAICGNQIFARVAHQAGNRQEMLYCLGASR